MKSIYYLLSLSALLMFTFQSCKKDVDDEAPVISSFTVDSQTVAAGSEIHADLHFTDNEALKSYKIDIHDNFDGHSHGKVGQSWSYQELVDISGKDFDDHKHIDVPSDAFSGPYHFTLYVLDAEGNQSDFAEIELVITNSSMPTIDVTNLDATDDNHISKGATLDLEGTIADAEGIDEIFIELEHSEDEHDHGKKEEEPLYEKDLDLGGSVSSYDLSTLSPSIAIPSTAESGDYQLLIRVKDTEGNIALATYVIHVM